MHDAGFAFANTISYKSQINIPGIAVNLDGFSRLVWNPIMDAGTVILANASTFPIGDQARGTHAS